MNIGDVVQFNEIHKWVGSIGIISQKKQCGNDIRYMVGIQIPQQGIAFIYVMESEKAIEYIGKAKLVFKGDKNE